MRPTRAQALALLAAATAVRGFPARAQGTTTIRICSFNVDSYAEPFYAIDEGFWRAPGARSSAGARSIRARCRRRCSSSIKTARFARPRILRDKRSRSSPSPRSARSRCASGCKTTVPIRARSVSSSCRSRRWSPRSVAAALLAEPFLSAGRNDVRVLAKAFDAIAKSFYISKYKQLEKPVNAKDLIAVL